MRASARMGCTISLGAVRSFLEFFSTSDFPYWEMKYAFFFRAARFFFSPFCAVSGITRCAFCDRFDFPPPRFRFSSQSSRASRRKKALFSIFFLFSTLGGQPPFGAVGADGFLFLFSRCPLTIAFCADENLRAEFPPILLFRRRIFSLSWVLSFF